MIKYMSIFLFILLSVIFGYDLDDFIDNTIKTQLFPKDCTFLEPELKIPFANVLLSGLPVVKLSVEHNDYILNTSVFIEQTHNIKDGSGKVIFHNADQDHEFYYLYWKKKANFHLFKVYQNICEVAEIDESINRTKLYGPIKHLADANIYQNLTAMSYLGQFGELEKIYFWQTCDDNNVYLYVTTSNVKKAEFLTAFNQNPQRIHAYQVGNGNFKLKWQENIVALLYNDDNTDESEISLPSGMNCYNEPSFDDSLNDLNSSSYYIEMNILMTKNNSALYSNSITMYFDDELEKSFITHNRETTNSESDYILDITDGRRKIKFSKNMLSGECSYSKLKNFTYSQDGPVLKLPDDIVLNFYNRDWWALFDSFSYLGKQRVRGLICKKYERRFKNIDFGPFGKSSVNVIRYYRAGIPSNLIQIDFVIYSDDFMTKNQTITIEFKELLKRNNTHLGTLSHFFDLSECFPKKSQHEWIRVLYQNFDEYNYWYVENDRIESQFRNLMERAYQIDFIRMPIVQVDYSDNQLMITAKLLEKPFLEDDFEAPQENTKADYDKSLLTNDIDDCFQTCLDDFSCYGFTFCSNVMCLFKNNNNLNFTTYANCSYIAKKGSVDTNHQELTIKGLVKFLIFEVYSIGFPLEIEVNTIFKNGSHRIQAIELLAGFNPQRFIENENKEIGIDTANHKFIGSGRKYRKDDPKVIASFSLYQDKCLEKCFEDIECNSFSSCDKDEDCILSSLAPHSMDDVPISISDGRCLIIAKSHISEYDEMNGVAMIQNAFEKYSVSKFDCAEKCSLSFKCQSFDHCVDSNICLLHSQQLVDLSHSSDMSQHIDLKQNCSHYSKNYLNKYYIKHNQKFLGRKLITLTKSSLQNCAKMCYQSKECLSFDFCQEQRSNKAFCHLLGHNPSNDEITKSLECSIYIRTKSSLATPKIYSTPTIGVIVILSLLFIAIGIGVAMYTLRHLKAERYL